MDKENEELLRSLEQYYDSVSSSDCNYTFKVDLLKCCKDSIDFLASQAKSEKEAYEKFEKLRCILDDGYHKEIVINLEEFDNHTYNLFKEFVKKSIDHYNVNKRKKGFIVLGKEYVNNITGSTCLVHDIVRFQHSYVRVCFSGYNFLVLIKIDDFKKYFSIIESDGEQEGNKD